MAYRNALVIDNKTILEPLENKSIISLNDYKISKVSKVSINKTYSQPVNSLIYEGNPVNTYQKIPVLNYCGLTEIKDLSDNYKFIYPVTIKVVNLREEQIFIAECSTFNLYSQAETYEGSLDGIKSLIVDDYLAFKEDYPDGLTDDAISVLRLYCAFFGQDLPY